MAECINTEVIKVIIRSLVDNRAISSDWQSVHGLSFYIETEKHRLLFDLGPQHTLIQNASKAGIDLNTIDLVVLSHGHDDHGGGLGYFLEMNDKAPVYVRKHAFDHHYSIQNNGQPKEVSLDTKLSVIDRFIITDDSYEIDDELLLFPTTLNHHSTLSANKNLYQMTKSGLKSDDFNHEQHLLVRTEEAEVLICGCAHGGISAIMETAKVLLGHYPKYVIGGFHLGSRTGLTTPVDDIIALAKTLMKTEAHFYTCHCTGYEGYQIMKNIMKDQLDYFATGNLLLL